jgi:hypothetical protein
MRKRVDSPLLTDAVLLISPLYINSLATFMLRECQSPTVTRNRMEWKGALAPPKLCLCCNSTTDQSFIPIYVYTYIYKVSPTNKKFEGVNIEYKVAK